MKARFARIGTATVKVGACMLALVLLVACGGGGDEGPRTELQVPVLPTAPPAPILSTAFGLKEIHFSWAVVSSATFYRLFEQPFGLGGFIQLGTDTTALTYNHEISLYLRANASYRLDACNPFGCTTSNVVTPGANLAQAIGYVKASNPGISDRFGSAVALSAGGMTLAVGAPLESSTTSGVNSVPNDFGNSVGAVYIFQRGQNGWSQQAYLKASNPGNGANFGSAVALSSDGNTLAVGAVNEDSGAGFEGAAYVFVRSDDGTWSQQARLKGANTGPGDFFGASVALSNDGHTLAVGAPFEDSGTAGVNSTPDENAENSGAVYVFTRNAGAWSQQAYLKASNTGIGDQFGMSVALSGDGNTLAAGAPLEDGSGAGVNGTPDESATDAGVVYVFVRFNAAWTQAAYLKPLNTAAGDQFGLPVALSADGNTLAAGAQLEDSFSQGVNSGWNENAPRSGAVYVFLRVPPLFPGQWAQVAYVKASNPGADDLFGSAVALSGDGNVLAVGAVEEDGTRVGLNATPDDNTPNSGAVYVFTRPSVTGGAGAYSLAAYLKAPNPGHFDFFGGSVALSGTGSTLAVGARSEDGVSAGVNGPSNEGAQDSGAVYLY